MAKLKIYSFPDIVLAQKALPIDRVEKPLHRLADDMLETMYYAPGIGLAANQVGILQRILVLDVDYDIVESEDLEGSAGVEVAQKVTNTKPRILINPEIVTREGTIVLCEGCLSVPEYTAEVKRADKIKVNYQDIDGVAHTLSAEGLLSVAIQHEIDHLDGKLFVDRLSPLKKEMIKKKLKQERSKRDLGIFSQNEDAAKVGVKKRRGI